MWKIPGSRFRRHKFPRPGHPLERQSRIRHAVKNLRHPTDFNGWIRDTAIRSHRRVFGELHEGLENPLKFQLKIFKINKIVGAKIGG
jgi:hypothetical protein